MIEVDAVAALNDNYIWMLRHDGVAAVVDPGDAAPVQARLERERLHLAAVILTHHHADHVAGAAELAQRHACPVFGPSDPRIAVAHRVLGDGETLSIAALALQLRVIAVPGHTLSHLAFHGDDMLFCGDTLFSVGCGRMFEGTPAQMLASLDRLARLPDATRVYCGHEYTVANCRFAAQVEPGNAALAQRRDEAVAARARGQPSVPSTIAEERAVNPFLRCDEPAVRASVARAEDDAPLARVATFARLRAWKDGFA